MESNPGLQPVRSATPKQDELKLDTYFPHRHIVLLTYHSTNSGP